MADTIKLRKVVAINCFDISPTFKFEEHTHSDWEFLYADSGSLNYKANGKTYTLSRGEIVFHRPGVLHGTFCDGEHSASFFNMIFSCSSRAMQCFDGCSVRVPLDLIPLLDSIIKESEKTYFVSRDILTKKSDSPDDGEQIVRALTELFLLRLRRHILKKNDLNSEIRAENFEFSTDEVVKYLSENITSTINLGTLSGHFHFGKTYLCEQFKRKTGKSIIDYFLDMKISKSKILLRESTDSVQMISGSLGFGSAEYFSRIFKKRTGYSPTEFRNMLITGTRVKKEF